MSRLPSSSSSSTFIDPPFQLDHHLDVDKRMTGKGFIEPHRDNLPRRKRKVVTTLEHGAIQVGALHTDKKILPPKSEAGPRSSIQESNLQEGTSPTSTDHATFGFTASVDTNITEPPSSIRASPTLSTPLHNKPPTSSNSSTNFFLSHPTIQTPKRSFFHGYHHLDDALLRSSLPITPSKGYLQPTSATLPRRHRLSVTREELRRKCLLEQQGKSLCAQELSKGIILGFLAAGDERDENIVRIIKVFNDSIPLSRTSTTLSTLSSEPYLQLTLPSDSTSYIDGTTSLTDSQIQQACTFIDEHISPPPADTSSINSNSGSTLRRRSGNDVSVLILTPCIRPEEAMSIGISYLAGKEDMMKGVEEGKGDEAGDDDIDDYSYSTVHRLMMAFHDDPGSPIPNRGLKPEVKELEAPLDNLKLGTECEGPTTTSSMFYDCGGGGIVTSRGLRPEWRGVLSFDGMERLDKVWTCCSSTRTVTRS